MSRNKLKPKVRKGYSQGFSLHFINVKFIILTLPLGNSYYVNIEYWLFTLGCMVYNNISQHSGADLHTISYLHRTECKLCARVLSCMNLSTDGKRTGCEWMSFTHSEAGTRYLTMDLGCQLPPRVAWVLPPGCSENHTWEISRGYHHHQSMFYGVHTATTSYSRG